MSLNSKEIEALIIGYTNSKDNSFLIPNTTNDFLGVRPSGNPITAEGLVEMNKSADLIVESSKLKKIHKIEANEDWGFAAFTLNEVFSFKGNLNNDLSTYSMIFKKIEGTWKIAWMQRSTGSTDLATWN